MEFIILLAAIVLAVALAAYVRRGQQKISCPQCSSVQVRTVDRQLKELKQDETMGYSVKLDVQLIMETKYVCQACGHKWQVVAPEK